MRISLRTYLAITFAVIIVLLSTVISVITSREAGDRFQAEIGQSLASIAYQMSDKLDHYMWSRIGEIEIISGLERFRHPDKPDQIKTMLESLKFSFPSFTWIGYMDEKGIVVASTDGLLEGSDLSSRPVYQEAVNGKFIGDVHDANLLADLISSPTDEKLQFVDISVPVKDDEGRLHGVLAAKLSWEWAKEVQETMLESSSSYNDRLDILVVNKADHTVLLGPEMLVGQSLELNSIMKAKEKHGWQIERWPDGDIYVTGYAYSKGYNDYDGLGWTLLVREQAESAFSSASELRWIIIGIGTLSAVLFGLIGWYLAGQIAQPIRAIADAADQLGKGETAFIPLHRGFKDIEILSASLRKMVENLTRTESALGRMEKIALRDSLTELPNRIALDNYLDEWLELNKKTKQSLALLYLDLDGFKGINDTHGHQVGDLLLQQVAKRLTAFLPKGGIAARLGGDEFVVAAPLAEASLLKHCRALGEKLIKELSMPLIIDGVSVRVGCSVGAALLPEHKANPTEVMRLADQALYISKRGGKGRVTIHGDEEDNFPISEIS